MIEFKLKDSTYEVTKVTVVRGYGTDKISISFSGPSSFTYSDKDRPSMQVDTTADYAEEWLEKTFGITKDMIEVIKTR